MSILAAALPMCTISTEGSQVSGNLLQKSKAVVQCKGKFLFGRPQLMGLRLQSQPFSRKTAIPPVLQMRARSLVCFAALNARCGAEQSQTQTVTRQSSTITIAPIQGKEKSPELDDGGTGFPPRDDDGDGGGGGGGGGGWSGGFFFFAFLAFLGFLKDQESEGPYRDNKRR
ncbi:hypothetical protein Scep_013610 [Stephania cephalantha]|uniref:Uncharacterized protein n=1 Tax=Stephania cephalantha TaxID=152367 RepID=A0AAP0JHM4_9MAGN